jgi:UDP-N-acetyl-D-mannosaminuronic acid dehydrogenase
MSKVCVIGLGYIGLPTALLLAKAGHDVVGVDSNKIRVDDINNGRFISNEPGLQRLLKESEGRFRAQMPLENADVFIMCVPTPLEDSMKIAKLESVRHSAESIAPQLKEGNLVVVESTIPPGTCAKLIVPILLRSGLHPSKINIAHCPERAFPEKVIEEMTNNDRIIGGNTPLACNLAKQLYRTFVKGDILLTDLATAEFVKLMENTYRDVNIALINELAKVAEETGIDIWQARELANRHPRVNYLKPGPGVGGHCIAVDPWFLTANSNDCRLINVAREINDSMPNYVLKVVKNIVNGTKDPVITVLGVAYKGNVEDSRETPALRFITMAENAGYNVKCYDPLVKEFQHKILSLEDASFESDCIVLITDHDVFRKIDPKILKMRTKNVVDTRNILDHRQWVDAGYNVRVLGCNKIMTPSSNIDYEFALAQGKIKILGRNIA